jgi:hypothetical protein
MNVILQARTRPVAVDVNVAIPNEKVPFDKLDCFSSQSSGKKRAKVQRAILANATRDHGAGKRFIHGQLDVWIRLVVAQKDVVFRLVLLDEIVLEC